MYYLNTAKVDLGVYYSCSRILSHLRTVLVHVDTPSYYLHQYWYCSTSRTKFSTSKKERLIRHWAIDLSAPGIEPGSVESMTDRACHGPM